MCMEAKKRLERNTAKLRNYYHNFNHFIFFTPFKNVLGSLYGFLFIIRKQWPLLMWLLLI